LYILQGVADAQAVLIVVALLIKANSSRNIALYVHHLPALGLADSPVIAPVPSGLLIVIYLEFLESYHLGSIRLGNNPIQNLAFQKRLFISHSLSTNSSFWLIT